MSLAYTVTKLLRFTKIPSQLHSLPGKTIALCASSLLVIGLDIGLSIMPTALRLVLVGDYRTKAIAHQAIPLAIERASKRLNIQVETQWVRTIELQDLDVIKQSDAVWVVPGSPYENDAAVFSVIEWVRENGTPFLGSCGGFQYAVMEYARNVLGWHDASNAEIDVGGRAVITPLSCSLVEQRGDVTFSAGSRIAAAYGVLQSNEGYHCNFGVSSDFSNALQDRNMQIASWDLNGEIRGIELTDHPYFVATLFQSERAALQLKDSPLVIAWMQTAQERLPGVRRVIDDANLDG
jgi:CTP synthase (UTP-ammonia lyase)